MQDGYAEMLPEAHVAALKLTDSLINADGTLETELLDTLQKHYTEREINELMLGVGLFLGMSKVLITLGLEPEEMPVTVISTPGSQSV